MPLASQFSTGGKMPLSASDARRTGTEAFVFGFPLVTTMAAMRQATNVVAPSGGRAPLNRFAHLDRFPDPSFRTIVAPNAHTLYSLAWLDLSSEPIVLRLPDTEGRSYLVSLISAWTDVIDCLGPRTAGSSGGVYALTGPAWSGPLPNGLQRIDAATNSVRVIGHTHATGPDDLEQARLLQRGLKLTPLSTYGGPGIPPEDIVDSELPFDCSPFRLLMEMGAEEFFIELAAAMDGNPPASRDRPIIDRLAVLGLRPGQPFAWAELPGGIRDALETGLADGKATVASPPQQEQLTNGWQTLGVELGAYGSDYLRRAQVANIALDTTCPKDACFPIACTDADGQRTNGTHRYRLRFEPGELPPVKALWSLAIYDMDQLCVSNPIDRYALGDRDELELGSDGSLEIAIQHDPPDGSDANWLPAPEDAFYLMLHMYWPSRRIIDGSWAAPPVQRVA